MDNILNANERMKGTEDTSNNNSRLAVAIPENGLKTKEEQKFELAFSPK